MPHRVSCRYCSLLRLRRVSHYLNYLELRQQGQTISEAEVLEQLKKRDYIDTHRSDSPLFLAEGVRRFDSTGKTISEVVDGLSRECLEYMHPIH